HRACRPLPSTRGYRSSRRRVHRTVSSLSPRLVAVFAPITDRRPVKAEIFPKCRALVVQVVQTAALQFGNNETAELLIGPGNMRGGDHEAVAGAIDEPFFHSVSDILRAADKARVIVERAPAGDVDEVARRGQPVAKLALHSVAHALHARPAIHLFLSE